MIPGDWARGFGGTARDLIPNTGRECAMFYCSSNPSIQGGMHDKFHGKDGQDRRTL